MKKLVTVIVVLFALNASAQTATYDEVSSKKKKGKIHTYITKNGETFSVGDTITFGVSLRNEQFDFILQKVTMYPVNNMSSGNEVIIKKMKAMGRVVYAYTSRPASLIAGCMIINFDAAIENGEIESNRMTHDKALELLKHWKDKYDLELISKNEYNKKKIELSIYIK